MRRQPDPTPITAPVPRQCTLGRVAAPWRRLTAIDSQNGQLLAIIAALLLALWGFVAYDMQRAYREATTRAERDLGNMTLSFSKEIESSTRTIDITLLDLREHWELRAADFDQVVRQRLATLNQTTVFQIAVIGADGHLLYTSLDRNAEPVDLSDREHFKIHRQRTLDDLFISAPLLGRVSARWAIQFSRPIHDKDGGFAGVIVLSVAPEYFYRFYRHITLGRGSVILVVRPQGEILTRYPGPELGLGRTVQQAPYLAQFAEAVGQYRRASRLDGVDRLYAWRWLDEPRLIVVVGHAWQDVIAPVAAQRFKAVLAGSLLSVLLILVGYLKYVANRQHQRNEALVGAAEERWRFALEGVGDGVWDWDIRARRVVYSDCWKSMLGYAANEVTNDIAAWKSRVHPEDIGVAMAAIRDHLAGRSVRYAAEYRMRCKNDQWKWILNRGIVVARDDAGRPTRMIGTHTDISLRKTMEAQLRELATTDPLTGLHNRRSFVEKLEHEFARIKRRPGVPAAVLICDLDHFKNINDTHGHAVGDAALKHFCSLLRDTLREVDCAGRLGGEEFGVLLPGTDVDGARLFADRLCRVISSTPLFADGARVSISVSIGIAILHEDDMVIDEALKRADKALYLAKEHGRNRCAFEARQPG